MHVIFVAFDALIRIQAMKRFKIEIAPMIYIYLYAYIFYIYIYANDNNIVEIRIIY